MFGLTGLDAVLASSARRDVLRELDLGRALERWGETVTERLVELVRQGHLVIRAGAARALGTIGGDRARDLLAHLVNDGDAGLSARLSAAHALGRIGGPEAVTALVGLLDDPETVGAAAHQLASMGGHDAMTALMDHVDDDHPTVRAACAYEVGAAGATAGLHSIVALATGDPEAEVRRAALAGLGGLADPASLDTLIERSRNEPDADVRSSAAFSLSRFRESRAVDALLDLTSDADEGVCCQAIEVLPETDDPRAVDRLLELLMVEADADPGDESRTSGLPATPETQHGERLLLTSSWSATYLRRAGYVSGPAAIRSCAAQALGKAGDHRAVGPLIDRLSDDRLFVRCYAAEALGAIGAPDASTALVDRLDDPVEAVRACAARALGALGDATAVDPLVSALAATKSDARVSVVRALGLAGDHRALEPLLGLLGDHSDSAPAAAESAMAIIARTPGDDALRSALDRWPATEGSLDENIGLYDLLHHLAPLICDRLGASGWTDARALLKGPTDFVLAVGLSSSSEPAHQAKAGRLLASAQELAPGNRLSADLLEQWLGWRSAAALCEEANDHLRHGRRQEALATFERAIEADPDHRGAWEWLGQAYIGLGRYDDAVAAELGAVERFPDEPLFWARLGIAYSFQGSIDHSISACTRAVEVDPGFAFGWDRLGDACICAERYDEAARAYGRAIELGIESSYTWVNLSQAYLGAGRDDDALVAGRQAVTTTPSDARAWYFLGRTCRALGRTDEAAQALRNVIELQPDDPAPLTDLGLLLHDTGQRTQARSTLERAVDMLSRTGSESADLAEALAALGSVLEDFGELDSAHGHCARAVAITRAQGDDADSTLAGYLHQQGRVELARGDAASARASLEEAVSLDIAALGADHPRVAASVDRLLAALDQLGERPDRQALLERLGAGRTTKPPIP